MRLIGQERHQIPVNLSLEELVEFFGLDFHHGSDFVGLLHGVHHSVTGASDLLLLTPLDGVVEEVARWTAEEKPWEEHVVVESW